MKAIIVNSSTNFEYRVNLIYDYLTEKGYDVTVIASDFIHSSKTKRNKAEYPYKLIDTYPYKKNISLQRLYSHYRFSRDAFREIRDMEAELLYLVIPQNSNAEIAKKYKRLYPKAKIIMDIVDMWPESLPVKGTEHFPFSLWAGVRNRNLKHADLIYTECRYYQEKIGRYCKAVPMHYFPWLKKYKPYEADLKLSDRPSEAEGAEKNEQHFENENIIRNRAVRLCYLGSVNNIIDMDKIAGIIKAIRQFAETELHIIGKGERMQLFIERAEAAGARIINHGAVYDEHEKRRLMDECDFGLNIMKDTVCVGLTMKSIDYMAAGLPMINNIPGDTYELIEKHHMGINVGTLIFSEDTEAEQREMLRSGIYGRYDRAQIREVFEREFEAKNIGKYIESCL